MYDRTMLFELNTGILRLYEGFALAEEVLEDNRLEGR
jgi:hypothetical protein